MGSGRHVISHWWQDHQKQVMAVGVVAWVVCITLAYHKVSARKDAGMVATILPVGGLPVT
jgi:hypothetical protein